MEAYEKIARILRTDRDNIGVLEEKLARSTGKKGVLDRLVEENERVIRDRLARLGVRRDAQAKAVYDALIDKINKDDQQLFKFLRGPSVATREGCELMIKGIWRIAGQPKGFFLKKEKAAELLRREPPHAVLQSLGYRSVRDLLANENLFEVWSALRFVEGGTWMNDVFLKHYEALTPDDFEDREIEVFVLADKWRKAAESFVKKKYHNISHLKELGVVFIMPVELNIPGELLRNFNLLLHYFNEVPFYSSAFEYFARDPQSFAVNLMSLLRGDVLDERLPASDRPRWLVIQRYLAKGDENDWRLFEPHVNPEALHWERALRTFIGGVRLLDHGGLDFSFWHDLNWVGDYFKTDTGIEALVSFNLVDTAMSLVQEKELIKYLYHHQEALWNKIFYEYFSEEEMERLTRENIVKGWFET